MGVSAFISTISVNPLTKSSFISTHTCVKSSNQAFLPSFTHSHSSNTHNHAKLYMTSSPYLRNYRRALIETKNNTTNSVSQTSQISYLLSSSSINHHAFQRSSTLDRFQSTSTKLLKFTSKTLNKFNYLRTQSKYKNLFRFSRLAIQFGIIICLYFIHPSIQTTSTTTSSSLLANIIPPTPTTSSTQLDIFVDKFISILPTWLKPSTSQILKPFTESFGVVFLSEFGDKSMFATALMAMKYNPFIVCIGAFAALTIMTFIACFLGQLMHYLPATITHYSSIALFIFFGIQMILQSRSLPNTPGGMGSERADAEEMVGSNTISLSSNTSSVTSSINIFIKVSSLIFVAEWCDRSMLATMALAASSNTVAVIGGATLANIVCTGMAVCAASIVASKISERMVALIAGILFEVFAVFTFLEGPEG